MVKCRVYCLASQCAYNAEGFYIQLIRIVFEIQGTEAVRNLFEVNKVTGGIKEK
jgi:hypothetical protein